MLPSRGGVDCAPGCMVPSGCPVALGREPIVIRCLEKNGATHIGVAPRKSLPTTYCDSSSTSFSYSWMNRSTFSLNPSMWTQRPYPTPLRYGATLIR